MPKESHNDRMPDRYSPEYEPIFDRAMQLSEEEICDLLELVGIKYLSRDGRPTPREELLDMPKDMLLHPLDEANSRATVEKFLREHGV